MATLLWLDDWRNPEHYAPEFDGEIVWVKSYEQFDAWLKENGLPDMISFDYELGKGLNKFEDGIGCAKAVIRACTKDNHDNPLHFPVFAIHSDHPDVYDLQQYITRNIDLYDLGEIRQVGKIHEKPNILKTDSYKIDYVTGPSQGKTAPQMAHGKDNYPVGYGSHPPQIRTNFTGRNDACPCGSGKKYKRCCIGK